VGANTLLSRPLSAAADKTRPRRRATGTRSRDARRAPTRLGASGPAGGSEAASDQLAAAAVPTLTVRLRSHALFVPHHKLYGHSLTEIALLHIGNWTNER
jgi:hypothetical protein